MIIVIILIIHCQLALYDYCVSKIFIHELDEIAFINQFQ